MKHLSRFFYIHVWLFAIPSLLLGDATSLKVSGLPMLLNVADSAQLSILGSLHLLPNSVRPEEKMTEQQIIPCTPVRLEATVWNVGELPSEAGTLQVFYKLPSSLESQQDPLFFKTEQFSLPILQPGEKRKVVFETVHTLPCLSDFIQEKWATRAYELVLLLADGRKSSLAQLKLTFSGYYYVSPSTPQKS